MKLLARLGLAALIGAATWLAILRIAEHKADALAGGGTFRLDRAHPAEMRLFDGLLDQLERWKQDDLAASLSSLQERGDLWIAPHLGGDRSAIWVGSLGVVSRVFVRRDELEARELPFPGTDIPDAAKRQYVRIRLAGTLYHELQHYDGLEDEAATYDREIAWYRQLREAVLPALEGEPERQFTWAVDSAIESARAARAKALEDAGSAG
jgi:hypothetical protein